MVTIKKGTVVLRETLKSGEANGRKWLLGRVDAERGYDKITVWADNADELDTKGDLQVVSISAVYKKNEKYKTKEGEEKWIDKYEINATLKPIEYAQPDWPEQGTIPGFAQLSDDSIPF